MFIAAIIVGLIIIVLIVLMNRLSNYSNGDFDGGVFLGILLTILCVIEIGIIINITEEPKPTPMDVYQGKTTLEYTIRDGEVIDSVVVFKNSVYGK
jgi:hypothetical protein